MLARNNAEIVTCISSNMLPSGTRLFKPHFKAREQMCAQQHQLRTQSFNSNKSLSAVSQGRGQKSGLKKRLCLAIIILPNGAAMSPSWRYTAIEMFLWPASFNKGTWSHAAEKMSLHLFAANGRGVRSSYPCTPQSQELPSQLSVVL